MQLRTWSGTYAFQASELAEPASVEALQEAVRGSRRLRALGTRHSFNGIADTEGTLVTALNLPFDPVIDAEARTVEFGAGTRYAEVAAYLQSEGWALHNMGSLPHISVAGAISTGTHGSGDLNGNLSSAVRGLCFVGADGELRSVRHGEPEFPGSVVALGALGVIVRVVLAIEPSYLVRQDVYRGLTWDAFLADVPGVTGAGTSVSVFSKWDPTDVGFVWVKRRVASADVPVPDVLLDAVRDEAPSQQIIESSEDNTTQHGVAGAWSERLPHFRIDSTPSAGAEIQTEYFVDRADAADALRAVRELGADIAEHLLITELRTIAADDLWLSPAYQRDSLAIHFTWLPHLDEIRALCTRIEAALAPFAPRPHWGKVNTMPPAEVAAAYPRMADFRALVARHDPDGAFSGPNLQPYLDA